MTTTVDSRALLPAGAAGAGRASAGSRRSGTLLALVATLTAQGGLALSIQLFDQVGVAGAAWLRLTIAGALLYAWVRPSLRSLSERALQTSVALGVVTAGLTLLFMAALERLPLGTATALQFLGPLGVAVAHGRGPSRAWAGLAGVGVLALTRPWEGSPDLVGVGFALAAGACWAGYILLTERAGEEVSGLGALAISLPVAALVVAPFGAAPALAGLTPHALAVAALAAVLLPLVPFALELVALRRLPTATFGTLMALEPAFALLAGLLLLGQVPAPLASLGVVLVVAAGVGAERSGARDDDLTHG